MRGETHFIIAEDLFEGARHVIRHQSAPMHFSRPVENCLNVVEMADRIVFEAIRAFAMPFPEIQVAPPKSAGFTNRSERRAEMPLQSATDRVPFINSQNRQAHAGSVQLDPRINCL